MSEKTTSRLKNLLNNFEIYLGAIFFLISMILLFMQVVTRYVFNYSLAWTEEIAVIMFIWMCYLGFSGAVSHRKQLRIDALINAMPFKIKKTMMIASEVFNMLFCGLMIWPMITIVNMMGLSHTKTNMLGIPMTISYAILPIGMVLMIIRCLQECKKLYHEEEKVLGTSKPQIDLEAIERERDAQINEEGGAK